jgi:hypothetical protein
MKKLSWQNAMFWHFVYFALMKVTKMCLILICPKMNIFWVIVFICFNLCVECTPKYFEIKQNLLLSIEILLYFKWFSVHSTHKLKQINTILDKLFFFKQNRLKAILFSLVMKKISGEKLCRMKKKFTSLLGIELSTSTLLCHIFCIYTSPDISEWAASLV